MMEPDAPSVAVEFDRVSLRFEEKEVLQEISFSLELGETKVILGATGSGKSVVLKLAMGLLHPDSGRIFVLGNETSSLSEEEWFPIRKQIGMVFQEGALFDSLTVGENVGYVFERMPQVSLEEAEQRVHEALRFVELEHTLELLPSQLSGGMRRRVALARALVGQPKIMLYDSPTAGLDPITASHIITLVIKQRDVAQVSSLLVTHRLQDAFWLASHYYDPRQDQLVAVGGDGSRRVTHTRFLVLREGDIAFHGSLQELTVQRDPYLQKFLL